MMRARVSLNLCKARFDMDKGYQYLTKQWDAEHRDGVPGLGISINIKTIQKPRTAESSLLYSFRKSLSEEGV